MTDLRDMSCRLGALSSWSAEMHLWGLDVIDAQVTLSRQAFSCCGGDGLLVFNNQAKEARLCGLSSRWGLLSKFLLQIRDMDAGHAFELSVPDRNNRHHEAKKAKHRCTMNTMKLLLRDELKDFLHAEKGKILDAKSLRNKIQVSLSPSESEVIISDVFRDVFWHLGATLTWHFDCLILPFRLAGSNKVNGGSTPSHAVLPVALWDDLIARHPQKRKLMLLDGVSELWNATRLERLEALIAFASERRIPVWIMDDSTDGISPAQSLKLNDRSFRSNMNKRLESLRSKPALQWLSDQSLSRLSELSRINLQAPKSREIPEIV